MKILVLGSGARAHAIILALESENAGHEIISASGNAGIARHTTVLHMDLDDHETIANFVIDNDIELVVIGPEEPLVTGLADVLRTRGIPVFGPSKAAAQLEGSKTFAKQVMEATNVPTGKAVYVNTLEKVEEALDLFGPPYVVKADGLAGGKGVLVTHDREAALDHASQWLLYGGVLIEEYFEGEEVSLFLVSDGHTVVPLSPAHDYKRLNNGDTGPNTGGMGAYSPVPWLPEAFVEEVIDTIGRPVIRHLADKGTPFLGLLYCGLILTEQGVRVLEFNVRFGDPEAQVILPRLLTPLSELLYATATGTLNTVPQPEFASDVAVSVVVASENYPDQPVTGRQIHGLDDATSIEGVHIVHGATATEDNELYAVGGRVINVVALGTTFSEARERAYKAINMIRLEGVQYRTDIAADI